MGYNENSVPKKETNDNQKKDIDDMIFGSAEPVHSDR